MEVMNAASIIKTYAFEQFRSQVIKAKCTDDSSGEAYQY